MVSKLGCYHIIGSLFVIVIGSLLHYVYQWSGNNKLVGVFGSVNESTWEHMKLLFWPMLVFTIIELFAYGKEYPNFIGIKAISLLIGLIAIPILFYTYTGIVGENYLIADISVFIISVMLSYILSYYLLNKTDVFSSCVATVTGIVIFVLLTISFIIFTFKPPKIALFLDPSQDFYGMPQE
ncbi:MAG: DUF6512 family protein [Clostridia bacterium]|nr:DUF6512 family protein [Clostridia bacterium]